MAYKVLKVLVPLLLLASLLTPGLVFGGTSNQAPAQATDSVRITVNGVPFEGAVKQGDVVHRGSGDGCDAPDISIKMRGDVKRVVVGPDGDTCDFKVKVLEMNDTPAPTDPDSQFQTASGWKWYVQSMGKVVGVQSVDDLTKTKAWFEFKTANINGGGTIYDGSGQDGSCWGKHWPRPPYYYYVDTCTLTDYDMSSSTEMYAKTEGEYIHKLLVAFGHRVTSKAIAYAYEGVPDMFDHECNGYSLLSGSSLECELFWEILGYEEE